MTTERPTAISLFSGAMGLDLGFEQAGFEVRVAVERGSVAAATIRLNRPDLALIERPIERVSAPDILAAGDLRAGDVDLVIGGPCCQAFSTAGHRRSVGEPRGALFKHYLRIVNHVRPRFFVMENVRGILSAAVRHRPLRERGPGYPPLAPDEELGSAFLVLLRSLRRTGYRIVFDVLDAADFGVPQHRDRIVIVGSRDGEPFRMPRPTHSNDPSIAQRPWQTLEDAIGDLRGAQHTYRELPPRKKRVIERVPPGGNWKDVPLPMQRRALGNAFHASGGRVGFFRRLAWDRPSPSLTTRPDSTATMLCHPDEDRVLSIEEYARIQQFPSHWAFAGSLPQQYEQVGNAVPVGLGRAIGRALLKTMRLGRVGALPATITCADSALRERLSHRSRTVVNPPDLRENRSTLALRSWMRQVPEEIEGVACRCSAEIGRILRTG
jgi:DNA (cytosine-5)-methyltransferase 1